MMRPIGRRRKPSEPSKTAGIPAADIRPANNRMVVAEFPQLMDCDGAMRLDNPGPLTRKLEPDNVHVTPNEDIENNIASVTPETRKLLILLSSFANTENKAARCDIDLSPGRIIVPDSDLPGVILIFMALLSALLVQGVLFDEPR